MRFPSPGTLFGIRTEVDRANRLKPTRLACTRRLEELWLGGRDSNPDNHVQSVVSYR
jgi:hypothetical protein